MTGSRSSASLAELRRQFDQRIDEIARRLLGEPNRPMSSRTQLRFGRHGSLAVEIAGAKRGQWYDHEAGRGGDLVELVRHRLSLDRDGALAWIAETLGIASPAVRRVAARRIVATYDYRDENGALLFQVVRYAPKTFRQRRPDGSGGWSWRVKGVRPVPYRLPELLAEHDVPVFVVEGEKDVDRLASLGFVATCNAGGANKWPAELNPHFQDLTVCILPDNDEAGRSHAEKVAANLQSIAASVRIVTLPGLAKGGDVSDWLDAGGDAQQLVALCQAAPLWEPVPLEHPSEQPDGAFLIPYCDEALTLAFSARHADDLRYCETFGAWFEWHGGRWREDITRRVFSLARRLCRAKSAEALATIENDKTAAKIASLVASAKTVAAVVNLARADARHATAPDDWDADPWALNTPDGIVDLRTGQTRPHDRAALCSKMTAVAPTAAECPRWQRFLNQVTAGDPDLQRFLRRIAGYGLTGSTREHALFFLYGTGANGKGTFLNTLTAILGDYAKVAGMDTFTESHTDRHPTELAMLRGARIVAAQETEEGRYSIVLSGLIRFAITRELPLDAGGFRVVEPDFTPFAEVMAVRDFAIPARENFLAAFRSYVEAKKLKVEWEAIKGAPDDHLIVSLAMLSPFSPEEKQSLLESPNLEQLTAMMTALFEVAVANRSSSDRILH